VTSAKSRDAAPPPPGPAPGWYPDPTTGRQRYWTGSTWTDASGDPGEQSLPSWEAWAKRDPTSRSTRRDTNGQPTH
jgi:hypothetical protein